MTTDWEEHIASLPDPTRDEKPPDMGALTKAEIDEIRAEKKTRTRRDWSNPAELMMCRILEGAFGAKNVRREADRMQGFQDANGEWHYHYANRGKPDITFAALHQGTLLDGAMEVKSVAPKSSGLPLHPANIKPHQIRAMDQFQGIKLWGLVFWEKKGVARCFVVGHPRFMKVINEDLSRKAEVDGRYQGKTLRRKDFDVIADCEILKGNRWYLPEGHWWNDGL